jgi:hypothetical protein
MNPTYKFSLVLWVGGTALIVASWVNIVTPKVGWIGFGIAAAGTLLSWVSNRATSTLPPRNPPGPLCACCLLHQSNDCRRPERPYAVTCPDFLRA